MAHSHVPPPRTSPPRTSTRFPATLQAGASRSGPPAPLTTLDYGDRYRIFAVTCPYHSDEFWQQLKTGSPAEWDDAVAFDAAIRHGSARANANGHPLRGTFWLHPSRRPLDQAPLRPAGDRATGRGCGPWTCPATAVGETPGEVT
jgi:hypothetical protein